MCGSLDSFHLAYVPAASIAAGEDGIPAKMYCAEVGGHPISIQRVSSLRLYRCRSHHRRDSYDERKEDFCTDNSSGNHSADISEHQSDEECHCCCCCAERGSSEFLPSFHSSTSSFPTDYNTISNKIVDADRNDNTKNMLAVLVPGSLTQGLINVMEYQKDISNKMNRDEVKDNSQLNNMSQRVIDAEKELRKSIHPCLCPNNPQHTTRSDGVLSFREHESINRNRNHPNGHSSLQVPNYPELSVCGIITSNNVPNCTNFPADVVLLAPSNLTLASTITCKRNSNNLGPDDVISYFSNLLNHETASNAPWSVIKAFPITTLSAIPADLAKTNKTSKLAPGMKAFRFADLPCCPVCLNLIEPTRLGLPELKQHHRCSQWCSGSNGLNDSSGDYSRYHSCVNEMKFLPWPPPAQCTACQVIYQRGASMENGASGMQSSLAIDSSLSLPPAAARSVLEPNNKNDIDQSSISLSQSHSITSHTSHTDHLTCHECEISTTLWVCLTCGIVGCGRYTLKHAAQHYAQEGHPYSLELATGRIWDYENGNFVHRRDLVECPVLSKKWGIADAGAECPNSPSPLVASTLSGGNYQRAESNSFSQNEDGWVKEVSSNGLNNPRLDGLEDAVASCHNNHSQHMATSGSKLSAPPKKSMMISQEYEALLQSALEDQSQHYEGEISRLRAELASSRIQESQISDRESREIHALQKDSERLKQDVERLSSVLLEAQTKEAKHRSMSQRLLREQSIAKELLEKIRKETVAEHESGKQRMEDLEMQIEDLTANLRMMSEFAKNEELSQAQIFGTIGGEQSGKKRGKKTRKGRKRG